MHKKRIKTLKTRENKGEKGKKNYTKYTKTKSFQLRLKNDHWRVFLAVQKAKCYHDFTEYKLAKSYFKDQGG